MYAATINHILHPDNKWERAARDSLGDKRSDQRNKAQEAHNHFNTPRKNSIPQNRPAIHTTIQRSCIRIQDKIRVAKDLRRRNVLQAKKIQE